MNNDQTAYCIGCGCDDFHACYDVKFDKPCHWLRVDRTAGLGVCSVCQDHVARWDQGDRESAVPNDKADTKLFYGEKADTKLFYGEKAEKIRAVIKGKKETEIYAGKIALVIKNMILNDKITDDELDNFLVYTECWCDGIRKKLAKKDRMQVGRDLDAILKLFIYSE